MSDWCILRTSGRNTIPLAKALADEAFEVWTPTETQRHPRTRERRKVPIMPSFVFASARHLWTLADMADEPIVPHGGFSVFSYCDRFPLVGDRELAGLRIAEQPPIKRDQREAFAPGECVVAESGVYTGIGGEIIRCKGEWSLVLFGGRQRVKISTFLLKPNPVQQRAKAA